MTLGKSERGILCSDSDIEKMLLEGVMINLAYKNYGEELLQDAKDHIKFLTSTEMRIVCAQKIKHPEQHLLDIIDDVNKQRACDGDG